LQTATGRTKQRPMIATSGGIAPRLFYCWFKMKFTVMKVSTSTGSPFKRVGL
jgi:hypothetical protein